MRSAVLGLVLSLATGALAEGPAPAAILLGTVVDAATEAPVPEAVVVAHSPALIGEQEVRERGVQGNMQVGCVVTIDGQVRGCKVVKGLPFMNGAVVDALEKRKYKPAVAQGKAVDVYYTFNIRLKLPSQ